MSGDDEIRRVEHAFGDGVQTLVQLLAEVTPVRSVTRVVVTDDLCLALGRAPVGFAVMTPVGVVRVDVEGQEDPRITELRGALAAAVAEIEEHNMSAGHVTRQHKVNAWKAMYAGDSMRAIYAHLDAAGLDSRSLLTETLDATLRVMYTRAELHPSPLHETLGALRDAVRYSIHDLPRWEDDGGAPAVGSE